MDKRSSSENGVDPSTDNGVQITHDEHDEKKIAQDFTPGVGHAEEPHSRGRRESRALNIIENPLKVGSRGLIERE